MRKITSEEIHHLYLFTRRHYVEYYDVQTELVDHLASAMEENWEKEPELSFEDNLQREFRKFGVFGFTDVVEKKTRAMGKRYFKIIGKEMKLQLQQHRVLFSLIVVFSGILMLLRFGSSALMVTIVLSYFAVLWFWIFKTYKELNQKKKTGEKYYLLEATIMNTGVYFSLSYVPFEILYFSDLDYTELWVQLLSALAFTLMMYSIFICFYVIPRKRDVIIQELYPELKF